MNEQVVQQLRRQDIGPLLINEPLSKHNSWCIGGSADLFIEPDNADQIATLMRLLHGTSVPLVVIGQGTNLLFSDAGVRGIVLKIGASLSAMNIEGTHIKVEAGCWVPQLARTVMCKGLAGLEHCIGIPGTVGGLVAMNGGSQRRSIGDNIISVEIVTQEGERKLLSAADCRFSYRSSALQESGAIVVAAELECPRAEKDEIRHAMLEDLRTRRSKFPRKLPNCGSVFLSSAAMHATVGPPGRIIEELGLKGVRIGDAEVSQQHANFIVNRGAARATDVLALIRHIRTEVRNRIGFELDCEVRFVSPCGDIRPAHFESERG